MSEPWKQDELTTLEAELRRALQHQRAAYEQMRETQSALETLLERAQHLLRRARQTQSTPEGAIPEARTPAVAEEP